MSYIAIDTETTGVDLFHGGKPFSIATCDEKGDTCFWEFEVDPYTRQPKVPPSITATILKKIGHRKIVFHNAKFDIRALRSIGIDLIPSITSKFAAKAVSWDRVHDTLLISHVLNSAEEHDLKALALQYASIPITDQKELQTATIAARRIGKQECWNLSDKVHGDYWMVKLTDPSSTLLREYNVTDAVRTMKLFQLFQFVLEKEGLWSQYERERKLMPIVYRMEEEGISLKPRLLKSEISRYKWVVSSSEHNCKSYVPGINIRSTKQLADALFRGKPFTLPIIRASVKTNDPSVDMQTLTELVARYRQNKQGTLPSKDFIEDLIAYRKANTAVEYLEGYQRLAQKEKGRLIIHPSLNQVGTTTTRFSHSHPNTANIAKQSDMPLRAVFGPEKGRVWWCLDYSQLELRILATVANDRVMQKAFDNNEDIHQWTADLCGIDRNLAKAVNYAKVYGAGKAKLSLMTGVDDIGERFDRAYPEVKRFTYHIMGRARSDGYITTLGGYRLFVPLDAAYVALNYLVQGSAGVILKEAMLRVNAAIRHQRLYSKCRMIMTIHDELVFEVNASHQKNKRLLAAIISAMENAGSDLGVRTPVEAKIVRDRWSDPKPIKYERKQK